MPTKKKANRTLVTNRTVNWQRTCRLCSTPFRSEAVEDRLCPPCRAAQAALAAPPLAPRDPAA